MVGFQTNYFPFNDLFFMMVGIGEVWANMLHNVYAVLVDERGFSAEKLTNPDGKEGNIVFMRLFMRSLSIQPCNPSCKCYTFLPSVVGSY